MVSAESFWCHSFQQSPHGEAITRILAAAIQAVEPGEAVRRAVKWEGARVTISDRDYDLNAFEKVYLLALGKASLGMAAALAESLGNRLVSALVITKHLPTVTADDGRPAMVHGQWSVVQGGHPVPNENSLTAGQKAVEFLSQLTSHDLLFCLISGGGSALMSAPPAGVTLDHLQRLTLELLRCGASIDEINALRRRLDLVKGGGVIRLAHQATIVSLILSDVVGNPLEAIASGPTAPDPSTSRDVLNLIRKYALKENLPAQVISALGSAPETLKPGDPLLEKVQNVIVGSNLLSAQAGLKQASEEAFHPYLLRTNLQGEARQAAFELATFLRQTRKSNSHVPSPACIVVGGETTVIVKGNGRGGRNTELALAAVTELAGFPGVMLVTLATDGEDGPTDAAGAVVTGDSFQRAAEFGLNPGPFLEQNDSYSFFSALGDLLKTGPTGTNVNDLVFLFTF